MHAPEFTRPNNKQPQEQQKYDHHSCIALSLSPAASRRHPAS
jgi:hypothetical protein